MKYKKVTVNSLLKEYKAVLMRNKRHQIWRFPNGKTITISNSSSDCNVDKVNIKLIKQLVNE